MRVLLLCDIQPRQRAGARGEAVGFDAEALERADEQIAQRRVLGRVEGQMLAVFEAASGKQDGQVLVAVAARVAQVRAEEHRGLSLEASDDWLPARREQLAACPSAAFALLSTKL